MSDYNEESDLEKARLEEVSKNSVLDYFGRFDRVVSFLVKYVVAITIVASLAFGTTGFLVYRLLEQDAQLQETTKTMRLLIQQKELVTTWTFAARLTADYFSMSYYDADEVADQIAAYISSRADRRVYTELKNYAEFLKQGEMIQTPDRIQYSEITVEDVQTDDETKQFFVSVPVTIRFQKAGTTNVQSMSSVFGMYIVLVDKSITNPFGIELLSFGKIEN